MRKSLQASEWMLVGSVLLLLALFAWVAYFHMHRRASFILPCESKKMIAVTISGAVLKPGIHEVPFGSPLKWALKKSRPKRFADMRGLNLNLPIESALDVHLSELSMLSIRIEGAGIEPILLNVPAGARLCDLKREAGCAGVRKNKIFRNRRLLKDGEVIVVAEERDCA